VALARALAPAPRLLLLDEPFSALDGLASDALLERLQLWLRANQVQAVMATHDVTDALAMGAEVLLLREGRLTALGPAAQVLAAERERLVARLQRRSD
jgi:ABC-type sulfate/molybdate transport systems ATPase subunit